MWILPPAARVLVLVAVVLIGCPVLHAREDAAPAEQSPALAQVVIPRLDRAPQLADFTDAQPDVSIAASMTKLDGFIQRAPDDGQPATQQTNVYLGYDQRYLYVVFVARDEQRANIRARLYRRESFAIDEDQVGIYLDTFHDRRRAYQFACNPLGVQDDSIFAEDSGTWDGAFDTVWDSEGRLTEYGYAVWMRIPFKSLRFSRVRSQQWGLAVWRWIPRRGEGSWWPRVSQTVRGFLSQEAAASGLEGISPGRNIQFVPYFTSRVFRSLDANARDRSDSRVRGDAGAGLDTKVVLKDSLVLDVTGNPDFAQVESDEPQTTINRRFEVFFPERRPFFTENANYFEAPIAADNHLLFTRRIGDPDAGARLTGKLDRFSIGALIADDRSPDPEAAGVGGRRALFTAVRVSRDLARQSNVGATYVERRLGARFNRVADVDATVRLGRTWAATLFAANSWTGGDFGSTVSRSDLEARINRQGRGFNYNLIVVNMAPEFTADAGFIFRTDNRYLSQDASYTFWPRSGRITNVKAGTYAERGWFFHGGDSYGLFKPGIAVELDHQTTVEMFATEWFDVLRPADFPALPQNRSFHQRSYGAIASSTHLRWLRLTARIERGTRLHYIPPAGQPPALAAYDRIESGISVRLPPGLNIDNTYLFERNSTLERGARMYSSQVLRTKWNWQLNRALSVRVIAEYDALAANPLLTSSRTAARLNADFLFSYLVHPGTALYVGWNSNLTRPWYAAAGAPTDQFVNDTRQLFVKMSYLVRY
jgi:uncharacterized protein DUF5916